LNQHEIDAILEENSRLKRQIDRLYQLELPSNTVSFLETDGGRLLFEKAPVGFLHYDKNGVILDCNDAFVDIIGSSKSQLIGLNMLLDLRNKDLQSEVRASLTKGKGVYKGSYRSVTANKETPVKVDFHGIYDKESVISGGIGISEDLTRNVQAKKALEISEHAYRELFHNFQDAIYIQDTQGVFLDVNMGAEKMYGYDRSYFVGKTPEFVSAPEKNDLEEVMEKLQLALEGEPQHFEFWGLKKNGEIFPKEVRVCRGNYHGQMVIIAFAHDISERKKAEKQSEIVYKIAHATQTVTETQKMYKIIKRELSELIDTKNFFVGILNSKKNTIAIPIMTDQRDTISEAPLKGTISKLVISSKKPMLLSPSEMLELERAGKIGHVGSPCKTWLGVPLLVDQEVLGVLVVQSYEKVNAFNQEDLQLLEFVSSQIAISIKHVANEEHIRKLTEAVEQSPGALMITDSSYRVEYANQAYLQTTGQVLEVLLGSRSPILVERQHFDGKDILISDLVSEGESWQGELLLRRKDGTEYWNSLAISSIKNSWGEIVNYLVMADDVTEDKRLMQQLNQVKKIESVGTLAGGIAHDFNNLLTVVNGYAEMLINALKDRPELQNKAKNILKSGTRAKEMTSKLLAFSRKQIFNPRILEINQIILEQQDIFQRLIGEDIQIVTHLQDDLATIKADPGQIEQILINLIINSRDAIHEVTGNNKKRIVVSTKAQQIDENFLAAHPGSALGDHIHISVSDTGIGMPSDVIEKIFDPFFTTKDQGKGTGLGLSTVYGIIKQNGGSIYIYSESGYGTTVNIYWPVREGDVDHSEHEILLDVGDFHGNERILLVEDDDDVREFSYTLLSRQGYKVQCAFDASEALEIAKQYVSLGELPDILVTDMIMPGMTGKDLASRLQENQPDLKVLFMSGYTNSQIVEHGSLLEGVHFLQKPFSLIELSQKVRDILDGVE